MLPIPSQLTGAGATVDGRQMDEVAAMAINGHGWPIPSLQPQQPPPTSSQAPPPTSISASVASSIAASIAASVAHSAAAFSEAPSSTSTVSAPALAPSLIQSTAVVPTPAASQPGLVPNPLPVPASLMAASMAPPFGSITAGTSAAAAVAAASAAPTLGIAPSAPAQVSSATAQVPIGSIGIKPPAQSPAPGTQAAVKRREIYKFESRDPLFAAAWSYKPSKRFRLAVGTIDPESFPNKVSIVQLDEQSEVLAEQFSFDHPFTVNCLGFIPDKNDQFPDLLATSADCLRIYNINPDNTVTLETSLNNSRAPNYASPLTNFDWNVMDPTLIGTCSIDTTCTIWELRTGKAIGMTSPENKTSGTVKTQLIAHDKPVHDIKFSKFGNGRDHFATVGADGSARMFDLRNLQHSTIVYEDPLHHPLMRLAWNNKDSHYLATFAMDANEVIIIDIRVPCNPLAKLNNHRLCVNGVAWAPHSHSHICTAGDDHQALIWDLRTMQQRNVEDPILAYQAGGEVNQVHWSSTNTDWISICFKNSLEILRV